ASFVPLRAPRIASTSKPPRTPMRTASAAQSATLPSTTSITTVASFADTASKPVLPMPSPTDTASSWRHSTPPILCIAKSNCLPRCLQGRPASSKPNRNRNYKARTDSPGLVVCCLPLWRQYEQASFYLRNPKLGAFDLYPSTDSGLREKVGS